MKTLIKTTTLLVLTILFFSCETEFGYGTPTKFKPEQSKISNKKNRFILKSSNYVDLWSIANIEVNGESKYLHGNARNEKNGFFNVTFENETSTEPYKFECEWFSINIIDNKTIEVVVEENKTLKVRYFKLVIQAGDAFQRITLEQEGTPLKEEAE